MGGTAPSTGAAIAVGIAKDVVTGTVFDGPDTTMIYFPTSVTAKRSPILMIRAWTRSRRSQAADRYASRCRWACEHSDTICLFVQEKQREPGEKL
jgi:hypothetical protein